jgi:uncharacterized repeat protein (TIGR03803 family)
MQQRPLNTALAAAGAARGIMTLTALSVLLLGSAQRAYAQTETVLYAFQGGTDGEQPGFGVPVMDKQGNLYGATLQGGAYGLGTAWKLTPSGSETILWSFGNGTDGAQPVGMAMDKAGNLYGVTVEGGAYGLGTAFKITPTGTESVLWSFGNGTDGASPTRGVVLDKQGDVYGTAIAGGTYGMGTVFEITPAGAETTLWNFGANPDDQPTPQGLILAKNGNIYGMGLGVSQGPHLKYGDVWELTPSGAETVLYSFDPLHTKDGDWPTAAPVMDKKGNLFSTCHSGLSKSTAGTVFELKPSGKEKVLRDFDAPVDGSSLYGGIALDDAGNIYGASYDGGTNNGGTVYELSPKGKITVLHDFAGGGTDGWGSTAGVALDDAGNVYGTTMYGGGTSCEINGASGCGTVFKITPAR